MTEQHELAHTGATGTSGIAATVRDDRVEPEATTDPFAHAAAKGGDVRLEFAVGDRTVVVTSEGTVAVRDDPVRTSVTE